MKHSSLLSALAPAVSLLALLAMAPANAVPCGTFATVGGIKAGATDLGTSSSTCKNSGIGDANDSTDDLNAGSGYFGINTWDQLTKTADGKAGDNAFWSFASSRKPNGTVSGTFSLTANLWKQFTSLVVVLKDGGSTTNKDIKWSAYLLPKDFYGTYIWSYDNRKELSHASLYGIKGTTTSVPEPTALVMLALGLAGATLVLRRQQKAGSR